MSIIVVLEDPCTGNCNRYFVFDELEFKFNDEDILNAAKFISDWKTFQCHRAIFQKIADFLFKHKDRASSAVIHDGPFYKVYNFCFMDHQTAFSNEQASNS